MSAMPAQNPPPDRRALVVAFAKAKIYVTLLKTKSQSPPKRRLRSKNEPPTPFPNRILPAPIHSTQLVINGYGSYSIHNKLRLGVDDVVVG